MGFGYLITGFIFLFNPIAGVYDVLPDFIGYIFILLGLSKMADLSNEIEMACGAFKKLLYIGAAQTALMFLVPKMEDKAYSLVFTFVFAVFEGGLLIYAFQKLFSGLDYLAMRHESKTEAIGRSDIMTLTVIFITLRSVFNLLPELSYLSTTDYEGIISAFEVFDISNYKTLLQIINIAAVSFVGVIWLIKIIKYFLKIKGEKDFVGRMSSYYEREIALDTKLFIRRRAGAVLLLLGIGCSLVITDIFLDGIDYIPDFIGAAAIIFGLLLIRKPFGDAPKPIFMISYAYFALSVVSWIFNLYFALKFYDYTIFKKLDSFYMYIASVILSAAEAAVFIALIIFLSRYIKGLIETHTSSDIEPEFKSLIEKRDLMLRDLKRQLSSFRIAAIAASVSSAVNTACMYTFGVYWMANALFQIVFLFVTVKFFSELNTRITEKYS